MKYNTLVVAPFHTRSGYGDYSRDVVRHLLSDPRFDVRVVPTRWGDTPMNATRTDIEQRIVDEGRIATAVDRLPDLQFDISVPPEFGRLIPIRARKLFGMTAGLESTASPPEWVEGVNRTDATFATSAFARASLHSTYNAPGGRILKVERPVEVVPISVDVETYRDAKRDPDVQREIDRIAENFVFLFVGHWLPGDIGNDRKDVGRLINLFCHAFAGNKSVALLLKTSLGTHSISDRAEILRRIDALRDRIPNAPAVYLLHGDLDDRGMSTVFRHIKVKSLVSLTHGEGFNIAGLQFSLSGKPILYPGYSGHLDYLCAGHPTMKTEETPIPAGGLPPGMVVPGAKWGTVPDQVAVDTMLDAFRNYAHLERFALRQREHVAREFSREAVGRRFIATLDRYLRDVPFEETLDLSAVQSLGKEIE